MPPKKSKGGQSANHLLNFQFAALENVVTSADNSPGLNARDDRHHRGGPHRIGAGVSAERLRLAHRIQSFQYILHPDVAELAMNTVMQGAAPTNVASAASPVGGSSASKAFATASAATSSGPVASAAQPQIGRALVKNIQSFDALVAWEHVYGVVTRGDPSTDYQCPICLEPPCAPRITQCGHLFCFPCILRFLRIQREQDKPRSCPLCHQMTVPSQLRRCIFQPVSCPAVGQTLTFTLLHRDSMSPLLLAADDPHLVDSVKFPPASVVRNGGACIAIPRVDDDVSWRYCRYVVATEDLHNMHAVLDTSALEERKLALLAETTYPMTREDTHELDAINDAVNWVARAPLHCFGEPSGTSNAVPSNIAIPGEIPSAPTSHMHDIYMCDDGQQLFLHFVCVKMIRDDCVSRGVPMPHRITATVLDIETMTQSEQTRVALKPLAHVPLFATMKLCFVDVEPLVSRETMKAFREVIERRSKRIVEERRQEKERELRANVLSMDDAWEKHKEERRQASNSRWGSKSPQISPTLRAFAIPLDDLPTLEMLPDSTSSRGTSATTASTGLSKGDSKRSLTTTGPSESSSLDTRQRATKSGRSDDITGVLTESSLVTSSPPSTTPPVNRWLQSRGPPGASISGISPQADDGEPAPVAKSAAELLFSSPVPASRSPAVPTWGNSAFVDKTAKGYRPPLEPSPVVDKDSHVDPFEQLRQGGGVAQGSSGEGQRISKKSGKNGKTISLCGTRQR